MVATLQQVKGFQAIRSTNGTGQVLRTFQVVASAGTEYAINDAVTLRASGKVDTVSAASINICGIVQGVFKKNSAGQPAPLTFNLPSNGLFLHANVSGFCLVDINPYTTYLAEIDTTALQTMIGAGVFVSVGAITSASGRSGQSLASSTGTSVDAHFTIIGLAPTDLVGGYADEYGDANGKGVVEVMINSTIFAPNRAGI